MTIAHSKYHLWKCTSRTCQWK